MQCYTELTPPTAVSHSVCLALLGPRSHNLVVAKTSLLQIFEIKSITTEAEAESKDGVGASTQDITADSLDGNVFTSDVALQRLEHTARLVLVGEYHLAGTVASLGKVKTLNNKSGAESLIVAFRDAKLSLMEWDPERHTLSTISIHYYESGLQRAPWEPDLGNCRSYLTVDPRSRCAALLFGLRSLAILPFRQLADDLADDDFDSDIDDPSMKPAVDAPITNGDVADKETPYLSSFMLSLAALDPTLISVIDVAFLYEYRDPTFGVLSSMREPSRSLLAERRDTLNYTIFTLDIEQKASTTILSVSGLPSDINRLIPLPLPVGGALLVGNDAFLHVDQAGKISAVAVNEFAKQSTTFSMTDQASLGLRLEGSVIEPLGDQGDLLIVLNSAQLAILSFRLDGRSVSGLHVHIVPQHQGGGGAPIGVSCACVLGRGKVFVGSEDSDSLVIGWSQKTSDLSRKRSHAELLGEDLDLSMDEDDLEDDDDLYGSDSPAISRHHNKSSLSEARNPEGLTFRVHDRLRNYAPVGDITFGERQPGMTDSDFDKDLDLLSRAQLVYPNGRGKTGSLLMCQREIDPICQTTMKIAGASSLWTLHARKPPPKGMAPLAHQDSEAQFSADADFDQFAIITHDADVTNGDTSLFSITSHGLQSIQMGDFESYGLTIDVGVLGNGTRIIHVRKHDVRCYDSEFRLEQMLPMIDEDTDAELTIISAAFQDPYLLLVRDDSSIAIFEVTKTGDLEELECGESIRTSSWISGCLYKPAESESVLLNILNADGGLRMFELPGLDKSIFSSDGLAFLPNILTPEFVVRKYATREKLAEILLADLGDEVSTSPYLIVRNIHDDISIYQPFQYPAATGALSFTSDLRWLKVNQPKFNQERRAFQPASLGEREKRLRTFSNIGGYTTVFISGDSPSYILKESSSLPRVIGLRSASVKSIGTFHTATCDRGFVSLDERASIRFCQFPPHTRFGDIGWAVRRINLNEEVQNVCYYKPREVYAISTVAKVDFKLPEDDHHYEWAKEGTDFLPTRSQGYVKLLYPGNWSIVDEFELEPGEIVLSMKSVSLEANERTHERRQFIAVGTAIIQGEDLSTKGHIYVLEIVNVVPHPDRPETNIKLKAFSKDKVKGAVTSVSEIGSQGFLLCAQGQKCMVRGLKEDHTILPVAFMDIQCYVTVSKVLKGTGMALLGDIAKGLWFIGYTEEPFRMILFGKSASKMEVMAAEFLPYEKQLYILVGDADKNIHVLQYDPENPKSVAGRRLIHRSTIHSGHFPVSFNIVPSTLSDVDPALDETEMNGDAMTVDQPSSPRSRHHVLVATQTGVFGLMTPVDELMYLRLNTLQTYLISQLDHACSLNPKAYRAVESERYGIKGIVDGGILRRWTELPSPKRADACARLGISEALVKSDLEFVCGGGLAYL